MLFHFLPETCEETMLKLLYHSGLFFFFGAPGGGGGGGCCADGEAGRFLGGLASKVDKVLAEIPMKEAVRYKKGNLKWTRSDVKSHSEALACGLLELGCKVRERRGKIIMYERRTATN